nr:MBOAT family protein [Cytophagales bacterium]
MLFNSQIFIYGFLPFVLLIYSLLRQSKLPHKNKYAIAFLVLASLFFYGWWKATYILLIIPLVLMNFYLGYKLSETRSKLLLVFSLALNLSVLGYFKYASFLSDNLMQSIGLNWDPGVIILPLGISFFIFQIIAYLVDAYEGKAKDSSLLNFSLFITFFPQLVAGPIVHHKEMMPQFEKDQRGLFLDNLM